MKEDLLVFRQLSEPESSIYTYLFGWGRDRGSAAAGSCDGDGGAGPSGNPEFGATAGHTLDTHIHAENSHLPFRRRDRAMLRFRQMKALQKFASVHANVHNHFSQERHLVDRQSYKTRSSAALAEWQSLMA